MGQLQIEKSVIFVSKPPTDCESRYSQIEKDGPAIFFTGVKLMDYVFGEQVLIQADHLPLPLIFEMSIYKMPNRLLRIFISLQD